MNTLKQVNKFVELQVFIPLEILPHNTAIPPNGDLPW